MNHYQVCLDPARTTVVRPQRGSLTRRVVRRCCSALAAGTGSMQRGGARGGRGRGRGRAGGPCRFGAACTRADCFFTHPPERELPQAPQAPQQPASAESEQQRQQRTAALAGAAETFEPSPQPQGAWQQQQPSSPTRGGSAQPCRFGAACTRPDCRFAHPAERNIAGAPQQQQPSSPTRGGSAQPCRFGAACTRPDCRFSHPAERNIAGGGDEFCPVVPGAADGAASAAPAPGGGRGRGGGRGGGRGAGGYRGRGGPAKQSAGDAAAGDAAATAPLLQAAAAGPVCCIDVECVATGTTHHDRSISQIALVDLSDAVICDLYVIPEQPVVSYLTPLTGKKTRLLRHFYMP
jgi:hypothetical protein